MATLREIVQREVERYAVTGLNSEAYLLANADGNWLSVIDIAVDNHNRRFTATSLVVHLLGDKVIIEQDDNNKPLVDALVQAGIPRSQIVLAYMGEPVPASV
jgi:hypothetical protein